jgi:hypothetical protein
MRKALSSSSDIVVGRRSLEGRELLIVDGLFKPDFIKMLHVFAKRWSFRQAGYDTKETEQVRHWRHDFIPEDFTTNPVLEAWRRQVEAKTAELCPAEMGSFDQAYCTSHGYGEYQHIHYDRSAGVTVIYYVNAEWDPDWQGETLFFDHSQDAHYAVAPQPGRLLMFPSSLLHRGGVPSRMCTERRLVMVLKYFGPGARP